MHAKELTDEEHLALVGLIHHMAGADGIISRAELDEMREIGIETGGHRFADAYRAAKKRFLTEQDALDFAAKVQREPARNLIHTILVDLARSDYVSEEERTLIAKVKLMWGIQAP